MSEKIIENINKNTYKNKTKERVKGSPKKKKFFVNSILLLEKLHRDFLEIVKDKLNIASIKDINQTQALILYNMGHDTITISDALSRGYYSGSNISYNLKKLNVKFNFLLLV